MPCYLSCKSKGLRSNQTPDRTKTHTQRIWHILHTLDLRCDFIYVCTCQLPDTTLINGRDIWQLCYISSMLDTLLLHMLCIWDTHFSGLVNPHGKCFITPQKKMSFVVCFSLYSFIFHVYKLSCTGSLLSSCEHWRNQKFALENGGEKVQNDGASQCWWDLFAFHHTNY